MVLGPIFTRKNLSAGQPEQSTSASPAPRRCSPRRRHSRRQDLSSLATATTARRSGPVQATDPTSPPPPPRDSCPTRSSVDTAILLHHIPRARGRRHPPHPTFPFLVLSPHPDPFQNQTKPANATEEEEEAETANGWKKRAKSPPATGRRCAVPLGAAVFLRVDLGPGARLPIPEESASVSPAGRLVGWDSSLFFSFLPTRTRHRVARAAPTMCCC